MSEIYYTSDIHIGHNLVAGIRNFWNEDEVDAEGNCAPDTVEHNAWLADIWDSTLKPGDQVFVLGDISINGGQHALDWVAARPGVKHLISGNHDPVHPQDRRSSRLLPKWLEVFETIQPFYRRKLEGMNFLLSHFPYESWGEGPEREGPARYLQYRLPDRGLPLLHGHTHGKERAHGNMFHVGVDAWDGHLVPQKTIHEWLLSLREEEVA